MTTVDRDQLLDSAKDFADRALKAYVEEDSKVILTNAAIGLEHLCKTYLCGLHPTLLMDIKNGQLDSLLHLAGHGAKAKNPGKGPRTISGRTAVERVQSVIRGLKVPQDRVKQLIDVRDGVVHVGYLDEKETREIFTAYLRLGNELFEALSVAQEDRWGRHKELVDSLISETLDEIEREVKHRMAAAKLRIDNLLATIPKTEHRSIMAARQAQVSMSVSGEEDWVQVDCPVCGDDGATCVGEPEFMPSVGMDIDGPYVDGGDYALHVQRFLCGACELKLNSPEEVDAAGLETEVDLPDPDEGFIDNGPWTID